ncbi:Short-chain dehydrogenase/reductase SDR [Colletotrichum asianum]
MGRILITGSTDGFGLGAARQLVERKHTVYLHARNAARAEEAKKLVPGAAGVFVADLTSTSETRSLAEQANAVGQFDAVILNAGLLYGPFRETESGVPAQVFVNMVSPYILACLLTPPKRIVFVASVLHREAKPDVEDIFWLKRGEKEWNDFEAYCNSKFHVMCLVNAAAKRMQGKGTSVVAMHPGYVPTKLTKFEAPDKMEDGLETYVMLAEGEYDVSGETGRYFDPKKQKGEPLPATEDVGLQEAVVKALEEFTGLKLPGTA